MMTINTAMRNIQIHRLFIGSLIFSFGMLLLSGCGSQDESQKDREPVKNTAGISIPGPIRDAALPGDELTVRVFNGSNELKSQTVSRSAGTATIEFDVSPGDYVFTIVFEFNDPDFGTMQLVRKTADQPVHVEAGATADFTFPAYVAADYVDSDGDGVSNLDELSSDLIPRPDPESAECQLGISILGSCSLG
jgi:hypothetical protein